MTQNQIQTGCHESVSWQSVGDSLLLEMDITRSTDNGVPIIERVSVQLDWLNTKVMALSMLQLVKQNEAQHQHDGPE